MFFQARSSIFLNVCQSKTNNSLWIQTPSLEKENSSHKGKVIKILLLYTASKPQRIFLNVVQTKTSMPRRRMSQKKSTSVTPVSGVGCHSDESSSKNLLPTELVWTGMRKCKGGLAVGNIQLHPLPSLVSY